MCAYGSGQARTWIKARKNGTACTRIEEGTFYGALVQIDQIPEPARDNDQEENRKPVSQQICGLLLSVSSERKLPHLKESRQNSQIKAGVVRGSATLNGVMRLKPE
jgi:hypothetical protein